MEVESVCRVDWRATAGQTLKVREGRPRAAGHVEIDSDTSTSNPDNGISDKCGADMVISIA